MFELLQTKLQNAGITDIILDKPERLLPNSEFLLKIEYLSSMRSITFYNYLLEPDTYLVDFTTLQNCPSDGYKVPKADIEQFIQEFVIPPTKLPLFGDAVARTWSRERTESLLELSDKRAISKKFFFCIDSDDVYSWLHRHFINCYALSGVNFNEAGLDGDAWGAAQYYTAYSLSVLNYEGTIIGKMPNEENEEEGYGEEDEEDEYYDYDLLQMHFVISFCYVPSKFGKQGLIQPLQHPNSELLTEDIPVDLAMALVDLPFESLLSKEQLIEKVIEDEAAEDYLVALNYMVNDTEFLQIAPRLLTSKNINVVAEVSKLQHEILNSKNE